MTDSDTLAGAKAHIAMWHQAEISCLRCTVYCRLLLARVEALEAHDRKTVAPDDVQANLYAALTISDEEAGWILRAAASRLQASDFHASLEGTIGGSDLERYDAAMAGGLLTDLRRRAGMTV